MRKPTSQSNDGCVAEPIEVTVSVWKVWLVAALVGLSAAWPLLYAALNGRPAILIRTLTGNSYHYLAIV